MNAAPVPLALAGRSVRRAKGLSTLTSATVLAYSEALATATHGVHAPPARQSRPPRNPDLKEGR